MEYIYFQVAVNSGGKHCLALSVDGEVYSFGEGDDGKLGHGNKTSADRPRVIEALRGKDISYIACGGAHSAAITATGNEILLEFLFRLFVSLRRRKNSFVLQYTIFSFVKITGELYTWGKGRYGRLGHGDSEDQTKPKLVEALLGYRVIDVACGKPITDCQGFAH